MCSSDLLFLEKLLALHDFKGDPLDPRNRAKAAKHIRDILYEAGTRARKIFTNAIQREKGLGKFSGKATPDLKVLERSETTTSRWLSGETKLADPDDSRVLRLLASIAPDLFKEVFGRTGETRATAFRQLKTPTSQGWKSWREFGNKPLIWSHYFWSSRHQALRRWIAPFAEEAGISQDQLESGERVEISPEALREIVSPGKVKPGRTDEERRMIYEDQIKPMYELLPTTQQDPNQYAFSIIHDTKLVSQMEAAEQQKKADKEKPVSKGPSLPAGIVPSKNFADSMTAAGVPKIQWPGLLREAGLIEKILAQTFNQVGMDYGGKTNNTLGGILAGMFSRSGFYNDPKELIDAFSSVIQSTEGQRVTLKGRHVEKMYMDAHFEMLSGELDRKIGLNTHTLLHLSDRLKNITAQNPVSHEWNAMKQRVVEFYEMLSKKAEDLTQRDFRKTNKKALDEIEKHRSRLRAYGIDFHEILPFAETPEQEFINDSKKAELEKIKKWGFPDDLNYGDPVTPDEAERLLSRWGLEEFERKKLIELYRKTLPMNI